MKEIGKTIRNDIVLADLKGNLPKGYIHHTSACVGKDRCRFPTVCDEIDRCPFTEGNHHIKRMTDI